MVPRGQGRDRRTARLLKNKDRVRTQERVELGSVTLGVSLEDLAKTSLLSGYRACVGMARKGRDRESVVV